MTHMSGKAAAFFAAFSVSPTSKFSIITARNKLKTNSIYIHTYIHTYKHMSHMRGRAAAFLAAFSVSPTSKFSIMTARNRLKTTAWERK